jgi:hypothetical protein
MPILDQLIIYPTVDHVLRAQGMDPLRARDSKPVLVQIAEDALQQGLPLLEPRAAYSTYQVEGVNHSMLHLSGGATLRSGLLARELKNARQLNLCVCTIGARLADASRLAMRADPSLALALDALGSAAVELLIAEVCDHLVSSAPPGWHASQPLGPGLTDWPISIGQPQIFGLVNAQEIGVTLSESCLMLPVKSASFVVGLSPQPFNQGSICDYCNVRETCRYRGNASHA